MDVDDFWTFIELSRHAGAGRPEREAFLSERLGRVPRRHLLDFVQHLSATREPANTYRLWWAADIIIGMPCGMDSFHCFQMWLVGLGRAAYEAAIADPDSLAGAPEVVWLAGLPHPWRNEDYPDWQSLEHVACEIGELRPDIDGDIRDVVSEERHVRLRMDPQPDDLQWARLSTAEVARWSPAVVAVRPDLDRVAPNTSDNPPGHSLPRTSPPNGSPQSLTRSRAVSQCSTARRHPQAKNAVVTQISNHVRQYCRFLFPPYRQERPPRPEYLVTY